MVRRISLLSVVCGVALGVLWSRGAALSSEPAAGTPFPKTEASPRERQAIEQVQKAKREILEGRKFNDLSTVSGAFLTFISAIRDGDQMLLDQVAPVFASVKMSAADCAQVFDDLARLAVVRRMEVANQIPRESDLCSVYTSNSPDADIGQVWTFGYIQGAWRFLNCTVPNDPWESFARKMEPRTREVLQQGVQERRGRYSPGEISEEIAVRTGAPLTVEIVDWNISLQPDLAANQLKIRAAGTIRNQGPEPLDHLDFDLLAAEKSYGLHVEIAKITGRVGDREVNLSFRRFPEQAPKEADQAGTHECPLVTRVTLPSALKPGQDCRLAFDYTLVCPDITQRHHYNPLWEPQEGKKEVCLIADFTWFPDLAGDLQDRIQSSSKKNFFLRGSQPTWHVTLTHPAELEGMVIDGQREKTERVGSQTVSRWKSVVGGKPQVFIGPAERIEKKGEKATVVFLLPKGKYDPEFVDGVADLVLHAYSVYTDWFGPLGGNEIHIVSPSGIRGGHGAVLGMTIDASYFRMKKSERLTESGKFFAQTPVHELAHSWWPESYGRGTKFLRESLGNFATWHFAREHYGLDLFALELQKGILDQARSGKPLFNPESDEQQFAYEKGPLVLDMLRQEMGNDVFFRMLKEYIRRYRDGHATFIDFVTVCNEVSQRDWLPFFYQWCYAKGCPGYHLVGFASKESKKGWETTVTIRNNGTGIVRCPLELRMGDTVRQEQFAIPSGREETFLYLTTKKVTGVAIDPKQAAYQEDVVEKSKSPDYLVKSAGYGRASNRELAARYDRTWLEKLTDAGLVFKTGLALYDMKRYEEALAAFERMEEKAGAGRHTRPVALLWQGHMLDLLGKREEAVRRYEKVAAMGLAEVSIRHDQFGIVYEPCPYAKQRMDTPFTRVENRDTD